MESVNEYISNVTKRTLYREEVGAYFKSKNVFIDTMSETLTHNLAVRFEMVKNGNSPKEILDKLHSYPLDVGAYIYCDDEGYGVGRISQVTSGGMMWVHFFSKMLKTMCSMSMHTVHDDKKRKLKLIC